MAGSKRKRMDIEVRTAKVLDLSRAGLSERQIAEEIGWSDSTVHKDIIRGLKALREKNTELAEVWVAEELERLKDLERAARRVLTAHHVVVNSGKVVTDKDTEGKPYKLTDDGPVIQAITALLRIAERRAKLLGLDAPTKIEQSGSVDSTVRVITCEVPAEYRSE